MGTAVVDGGLEAVEGGARGLRKVLADIIRGSRATARVRLPANGATGPSHDAVSSLSVERVHQWHLNLTPSAGITRPQDQVMPDP